MDNDIKQFILAENEKLAGMIAKSFDALQATMATKEEMQRGFAEMDKRFDVVEERLDRIEASIEHHGTDIDRVTDDVRVLKTKAGIL